MPGAQENQGLRAQPRPESVEPQPPPPAGRPPAKKKEGAKKPAKGSTTKKLVVSKAGGITKKRPTDSTTKKRATDSTTEMPAATSSYVVEGRIIAERKQNKATIQYKLQSVRNKKTKWVSPHLVETSAVEAWRDRS